MSPELETLSARVVSALCNGVYQGVLLTLLVGLGLKLFRGANAATRYTVELATLLMVAALPVIHFIGINGPGVTREPGPRVSSPVNKPDTASLDTASGQGAATGASAPEIGAVTEPELASVQIDSALVDFLLSVRALEFLEDGGLLNEQVQQAADALVAKTQREVGATPASAPARENPPEVKPASGWSWPSFTWLAPAGEWRPPISPAVSVALVAVWLGIAMLRSISLLSQYALLLRCKRDTEPTSEAVQSLFDRLCRELGIRRRVQLRVGTNVNIPVVVGAWRPAVLIPSILADEPGPDLERILRHELAHVRRGDDWTNLLHQGIRAWLFFHPGVWWLSRRLTVDREIACDDLVLAASRSRRDYALLLTEFASRTRGRSWAAAPGAWSSKHQLKERISMILDSKRNASTQVSRRGAGAFCSAAVLAAAMALYAGPRLALAGDPAGEETSNSDSATSYLRARTADGEYHHATITLSGEGEGQIKIKTPTESGVVVSRPAVTVDAAPVLTPAKPIARVHLHPEPTPTPTPSAPIPPTAPRFALAAEPPQPPRPSSPLRAGARSVALAHERGADAAGRPADEALERRLERLERMVESLLRRDGKPTGEGEPPKPPRPGRKDEGRHKADESAVSEHLREHLNSLKEHFKDLDKVKEMARRFRDSDAVKEFRQKFNFELRGDGWEGFEKDIAKGAEHLRSMLEGGQFGSIAGHMEEVKRTLEQAAREVERAAREAQQAVVAGKRERLKARGEEQSAVAAARRALEQQRKALERQIEQIENQLDRLDSELDRVEEELDAAEDQEESGNQNQDEQADHQENSSSNKDEKPAPEVKPEPKRRAQ